MHRIASAMVFPCLRCGHPALWHRLDDSQGLSPMDPKARFRCLGYDPSQDGTYPEGGRACGCPDFARKARKARL